VEGEVTTRKKKRVKRQPRKIVQVVSTHEDVLLLDSEGCIWEFQNETSNTTGGWVPLKPPWEQMVHFKGATQ
jgi:alpha-tubulin suppressor-like RCC1 family protein